MTNHRPDLAPISLGNFLQKVIPRRGELLGTWLKERQLVMVHAPAGVGKSWFAYGISLAVAGGSPFLDWEAREPRKVLYVDGEMDSKDIQDRLKNLLESLAPEQAERAQGNFHLLARDQMKDPLDFPTLNKADNARRADLDVVADKMKPALVVLDNVSCLSEFEDENDACGWTELIEWWLKLRSKGISVLVVQHNRKGGKDNTGRDEGFRGSVKQEAVLNWRLSLTPDKDAQPDGMAFTLTWPKKRGGGSKETRDRLITYHKGKWGWSEDDEDTANLPAMLGALVNAPDAKTKFPNLDSLASALSQEVGHEVSRPAISKIKGKAVALGYVTTDVAEHWSRRGNPGNAHKATSDF